MSRCLPLTIAFLLACAQAYEDFKDSPVRIAGDENAVITGELDKSLVIRCLAYGYPIPKVFWTRENRMVPFNNAVYETRGNSLLIRSLGIDILGQYTCVAYNEIGGAASWEVLVRAYRPEGISIKHDYLVARNSITNTRRIPLFTTFETTSTSTTTTTTERPVFFTGPRGTPVRIAGDENAVITGELDKPLVIHCLAYGYPIPKVFFTRDNRMVPLNDAVYEIRGNSLLIRSLGIDTLGKYTCEAYNEIGSAASWVMLVRAYRPEGLSIEHDYLVARNSITTTRRIPLSTTLETTSTSTTTTTTERPVFFAESTTEETTSEGTSTSESSTSEGSTSEGLTSKDSTSEGATSQGSTSEGSNSKGSTSEGSTSEGSTSEGSSSESTSEGISYSTESSTLPEGCVNSKFGCCYDNDTEALGPDMQGCMATELSCCPDGVSPDPKDTPVRIAGDENAVITGELDKPLVVRCLAYGYPVPDVFWTRNNYMVPFNDAVYKIRGNSLLIRSLSVNTLGQYTCQAYNGIGKAASWVVLVRAYKPEGLSLKHDYLVARNSSTTTRRIPLPTTLETTSTSTTTTTTERPVFFIVPVSVHMATTYSTLNIGAELRLSCEVDGFPEPTVYWTKDGQRLVPDERTSITGNSISRLAISRVSVSDSGSYGCHADNGYSSHSDNAQINVQQLTVPAKCTDNPFFANCSIIVLGKFCNHKYYSKFCCKSCVEAGQLDPQVAEAQANQPYRKN